MRIVLIGPTYPFRGGISHYTTLLFRHLKKRHDTILISFKRQYPKLLFPGKSDIDPSKKQIRESGVSYLIDSMNPLTWLNTAVKIMRYRPELVIFPWWVSFWAPQFWTISNLIRRLTRSRIIFLCHNLVEHESKWFDRVLTRVALSVGDFFIVHSKEERQGLLSMFPQADVRKNPHPNYDVFNFKTFDNKTIRDKYGLQGKVLLFFGFVREYKGLNYLIEALPQVLEKIEVTLLVAGEFWKDKDIYLKLIKDKNLNSHIVIVDRYIPNEEVGSYFSAADLVVQPYVSATGSGVIQTAFGFNKPVIATKVGSLPEIVENGKTGFLVPPRDPEALANGILRFFHENKSKEFSRRIIEDSHRFSWEQMVRTIENFSDLN